MEKKLVPRRQYTQEFKAKAARLAESVGQHEAARRLGVPVAAVGNWARPQSTQEQTLQPSFATPTWQPVGELQAEISRLRKELASSKLDGMDAC